MHRQIVILSQQYIINGFIKWERVECRGWVTTWEEEDKEEEVLV